VTYRFLSDEWFDAVESLRPELDALRPELEATARQSAPELADQALEITVNLIVTGGPDGVREMHISGGRPDRGLVEGAPTSVELPYEVAKNLFLDGRPDGAFSAFLAGKLVVRGDLTKLIALQPLVPEDATVPPAALALFDRVKALTA
jgi:hypothetical protein